MNKININQLKIMFEKEGFELPYIGKRFSDELYQLSDFIYGSRKDAHSLYGPEPYFYEVLKGNVKDYILMGFDGHGVNSWAVHYYYVTEAAAIFIQLPWGGIYGDRQLNKDIIQGNFWSAELLIERIEQRMRAVDWHQDERLVVKVAPLSESKWGWAPLSGAKEEAIEWHGGEPVIVDASLAVG